MTWATNIEKGFHLVITSLWMETIVLKCRGMYVLLPCKYIPKYIQGCYFILFKAACSFLYNNFFVVIFVRFSQIWIFKTCSNQSKLCPNFSNLSKIVQTFQNLFSYTFKFLGNQNWYLSKLLGYIQAVAQH